MKVRKLCHRCHCIDVIACQHLCLMAWSTSPIITGGTPRYYILGIFHAHLSVFFSRRLYLHFCFLCTSSRLSFFLCLLYLSLDFAMTFCRGGSRLVGRGVSLSRSHMSFYLRTGGGGGTTHVSFYLQKG